MFYVIGALFALVISVILIIAVMDSGTIAYQDSNVSQLVNEINQIRLGVLGAGFNGDYASLNNDVLEELGAMPSQLIKGAIGAGNDFDPLGGPIGVGMAAGAGYGNYCFEIIASSPPPAACIALATQVISQSPLCLGGTLSVAINGAWYGTGQRLSPTAAAAACTQPFNRMMWYFN